MNADYYKRAISIVINDMSIRNEMVEFIKKSNYEKVSDELKKTIVSQLQGNHLITFESGEIYKNKNNIEHIAFWLTRFRDISAREILKTRPKHHMKSKPITPIRALLYSFVPMYKKMMYDSVKMGVIHIKFPGGNVIKKKFPSFTKIGYKFNNNMRYTTRYINSMDEPCCLNIDSHKR